MSDSDSKILLATKALFSNGNISLNLIPLERAQYKLSKAVFLFENIFSGSKIINILKVSTGVKIRNRYNQVPHLTQDTNGKVTNSQ